MMRRCPYLATALLAVLGGLWPGPLPAAADDPAVAQRELAQLRARIKAVEQRVQAGVAERGEAQQALRAAEVAEADARRRLAALERELQEATAEQARLEASLQAREAELARERAVLARALQLAYVSGRDEWLRLVLSGDDPVRTGRRLVYYGYLGQARADLVAGLRERLAGLAAARREVLAQAERLAGLQARQQARLAELEAARAERASVVARLDSDIAGGEGELARLRREADDLAALVAELTRALAELPADDATPFGKLKGRLPGPADGPVLRNFGQARADGRLRWEGSLIGAAAGSPVRAVHHGRVVYADWLPGMGLLAIVEHGDGYLSLYGHNRDLVKDVGDWVDAGDVLGHVGDSGGQAEAGLYFEIRKDGRPQDPRRWLAR